MNVTENNPPTRPIGVFLAAFFLFAAFTFFGILLTRAAGNFAVFWPANAAMVWLSLVVGARYLPQILIGGFLANAAVQFAFGDPLILVFGLPLANSVEIALVILGLNKFNLRIGSITDPVKAQIVLAILCAAAVPAAIIGAGAITLAFSAPFTNGFIQWWAADVVSLILVLLLILSPHKSTFIWDLRKWSALSQVGLLAGILVSGLSIYVLGALNMSPAIGIILPLLWIALHCGMFTTALASACFSLFAIGLVATGYWHAGFLGLTLHEEIFRLQVSSMLCALPALFIAASISSRDIAYKGLSRREQQASLSFAEVQMTLANMNQGISCFDKNFNLTIWNRQYAEMFGMNPDNIKTGAPFLAIIELQKSKGDFNGDPRDLLAAITKQTDEGKSFFAETVLDGGRIIKTIHAPNPNGGWVATHEDVTNKRNTEKSIVHDALHDALTGLPNRRYHEQELGLRAAKCQKFGGGVALLHIDLDRFKQINDTMGHAAGDAMLVHAGKVLRSMMREEDFVARIGGDEFVAVCNTTGNIDFLTEIAKRIITKMHEPVPFEDKFCRFGVSIGIAHQNGQAVDCNQLPISADLALYRAKNRGRGCFELFTDALHTEVISHKKLSDEIMTGIEQSEFVTYYQPQIDAKKNVMCGVEALVRWQHPTRGLLAPDAFISVAEEIHQVALIDQIVLRQTLKDMARWKKMGIFVPHASVNVSARRLNDPGLIASLKSMDIQPGQISFELIESIYLDEADGKVMGTIDQIKELGIDIELDDFGTGYTSIVSLHAIKPKRLKIDRRLVIPIVNDPQHQKIVSSVIDIAKSLNIITVAEGVETLQHAKMLMAAGCNLMQGYVYARPMSARDLEAYVSRKGWKTIEQSDITDTKVRPKKIA